MYWHPEGGEIKPVALMEKYDLSIAKLAELQPYFAFHPRPLPFPPPMPVDSKLQLGDSWLSKQPQLVGS